MARLFQDGFEYNNVVNNYPWTINGGGAATYVTTTIRNGTYAGQISGLTSATRAGWLMQFAAATGTGPYYCRFYINITTLPSSNSTIFAFSNGTALSSTQTIGLKLNSVGNLTLINAGSLVGSGAGPTTLATGRWYMIEVKFDNTGGAGHGIGEVKIDGVVEVTSSTLTYAVNSESFMLGGNLTTEAVSTGKWFFDDIALNDSTGASQTGYPGQGNIVRLKPNAAGDNNQFITETGGTAGAANNYTRVNAVDLSQSATFNGDKTNGHIDDFNMEDTPSSINANSTINVVTVDLAAFDDDVTTCASIQPRIKKTAAGTVSAGTAFTPPNSQVVVVNKSTFPKNPTLVLYNDPDGAAWTKTTLGSMQAGYKITATASINTDVTNLSVQVDFVNNYVESTTISSRTVLSSVETPAHSDSSTLTSRTTLSSVERHTTTDSSTISTVTSLIRTETKQSADSTTISSVTSLSRTEITRFIEASTISLITSLMLADILTAIDAATIASVTSLSSTDTTQYVDSGTIQSETVVSSTEFSVGADTAEFATKTTISASDVAAFVDSQTASSVTTPITITELKSAGDQNTIATVTELIYTEVFDRPIFPITSVTTIVQIAEVQYIVELVAVAYKRYITTLLDTNHYTATLTKHFTCESDNHYDAQAVTKVVAS